MKASWILAAVIAAIPAATWAVRALACGAEGGPPIACRIGALTPAERARHHALIAQLASAVRARRELPAGFAFEVDPARMRLAEVGEWAELEHRCCPFFAIELSVAPEDGPITLTLTGRDGVKDFIREELAGL